MVLGLFEYHTTVQCVMYSFTQHAIPELLCAGVKIEVSVTVNVNVNHEFIQRRVMKHLYCAVCTQW